MSFFYDLNKKLDSIRATPEVTHQQLNERDMKKTGKLEEEGFPRIQAAIQKYTQPGVNKLAKLGREGASKEKMDRIRNKNDKYATKKVSEESGEWSKIPVGVIDGPGGYDGAQQRIRDYESGNINRDGKKLPPVVDRSRPADKPTVYNKSDSEEYSSPPEWKGGYRPPVVDRSRPVKSVDEDMYNQGGVYKDLEIEPKRPQDAERKMTRGTRPAPKGEFMGTIKGGVWTADPPKPGEKGVPVPKNHERVPDSGKKLNFADKIANAKKEVDEMLGDVAAEAMRSALGGGKGRNAEMDEEKSKGTAFDMSTKRVDKPKVGSIERGHKHDIKHTATGRMVTRRTDAQGNSVGADDDTDTQAGPRGRGRPKGTTGAIGAKGPSGKSKLMTKEGSDQGQAQQVVDDLAELRAAAKQAQRGGEFPQGFASRLEVVLYAAITLIRNQQPGDAQVREEEKTSTRDDHAEKAGKKVAKDIEYDEKKKDDIHGKKRGPEDAKAEKAGKKVAKDIEHDEKKKEKEVDESTTSGSVATSTATKSSKGSMVGKGIYDSMNFELEQMIAESMQNEDAPRSWQQAADKVGTIGGAALGGAGGAAAGALIGTSVFGPLGIAAAAPGGLAGLTGGAALGGKLAKSAVNTAHDAGVGLYRKISSMLGGPEGTIAFAKAHIKAASSGQDSFEFGGKNYNVTMSRNEARQLEDNQNVSIYDRGQYDQLGYPIRKGVPLNRGLVRESMSINMSDSTEGNKSLSVTATDDDAMKLAMILKSAGLGSGDAHGSDMHSHGEQPCATCGMPDCGCDDVQEAVDENSPDYPTNTEQANNNFGYAGGLDGPKSTGQSTVPVLASQDDRQHSYAAEEEDAIKRMMEMAGLAQANLTPGKHTMQAMGPEMSYSDSDPEKIKYDNWLRKASDKDLWDEASKYESVPDYIGREFEKLVAQQKELLGPAAYREKGINDRLKSKLKKYPNMSAPMKEEEEVEEDFLESIQRMREIAGIKEAKKDLADKDYDGDGNLETGAEEHAGSVDKAIKKSQEEKKVDESIFALTNQWQAYKG